MKLAHVPLPVATGAYIVSSGQAAEGTLAAAGAIPTVRNPMAGQE
jgi:hypothetical protein